MGSQMIEIIVGGELGPTVAAALEGFTLTTEVPGRTRVVGTVPDQARLMGTLEMLDALHIEVISVNPLEAERP